MHYNLLYTLTSNTVPHISSLWPQYNNILSPLSLDALVAGH
jgi:hypothetical protein